MVDIEKKYVQSVHTSMATSLLSTVTIDFVKYSDYDFAAVNFCYICGVFKFNAHKEALLTTA